MKIKSEKQSSNVNEPGAEGGSSPLPFDPGRGLLLRHRNGVRQELSPSAFAVNALKVES
jgi:hypothetical protein